jgi:NADH-quinone oxidoreductase subunit L
MFRLYTLTFEGEPRWTQGKHPHESPLVMTVPLMILGFLSIVGGFLGVPASLGGSNAIEHWLDPVFERARTKLSAGGHESESLEYVLMALSVAIAAAGIFLAWTWYLRKKEMPQRVREKVPVLYTLLWNKYYVDEAYDAAIVNPIVRGSEKLLWKGFDIGVIDWLVNGVARLIAWVSRTVRVVQTGVAESYVFVFLVGVFIILGWLIAK